MRDLAIMRQSRLNKADNRLAPAYSHAAGAGNLSVDGVWGSFGFAGLGWVAEAQGEQSG